MAGYQMGIYYSGPAENQQNANTIGDINSGIEQPIFDVRALGKSTYRYRQAACSCWLDLKTLTGCSSESDSVLAVQQ
jgi:hypothetical protein